uniref:UDENN domain-containing protein n=1 Tax=Hucho hucho TaxID=62062 RepID=A0A4W5LML7_9TELE
ALSYVLATHLHTCPAPTPTGLLLVREHTHTHTHRNVYIKELNLYLSLCLSLFLSLSVSAPMPFLIGVHSSLTERVRSRGLEDVVILNVDTNTIESPFEDLKKIPADVVM